MRRASAAPSSGRRLRDRDQLGELAEVLGGGGEEELVLGTIRAPQAPSRRPPCFGTGEPVRLCPSLFPLKACHERSQARGSCRSGPEQSLKLQVDLIAGCHAASFAAKLKSVRERSRPDGRDDYASEAAIMETSKEDVPLIVLVAEDEALVRLLANDMLTDADYRVVEAQDGQEALAILGAKNTVRALLTDVNMPNVDGLALARIVRQRWPHIGVVVTSGRPLPSALPAGARFISKPYRYEDVVLELEAVISRDGRHPLPGDAGMPSSNYLGCTPSATAFEACRSRSDAVGRLALTSMRSAYSSRGDTMNEFQENLADTAERTLAERHMEAVRQQGGMFVEAVRVTRMPMLVTDATLPGNPIIFVNRAFTELSGYAEEELLGQDPHFMNGADTDPVSIRQYEAAIEDTRDETLEILQYRKDGAPFRAMLFASPLDDGQGKVTNHFLSYLDITRRYDAEDKLRSLTSDLEKRVAQRTQDLEASNEKLQAANDRLSRLLAERQMLCRGQSSCQEQPRRSRVPPGYPRTAAARPGCQGLVRGGPGPAECHGPRS